MDRNSFTDFYSVFTLTLALFVTTFIYTGCFYETNDDVILTFLISGVFNGQPMPDLTLYLHGLSQGMAFLYQIFPGVPWYGFVLYCLLFCLTWLTFWLIYKHLRPVLTPGKIYLLLTFLYIGNWYEHVFWFNYSRLPILLAGIAGLMAVVNRQLGKSVTFKQALVYGLLFLVALCIRPSLAFFGFVLVMPLLLLPFGSKFNLKKTTQQLLPFVLAGIIFSVAVLVRDTPAQKEYRRYDVLKSKILDYYWCCSPPASPTSKLLYAGISQWFLADKNITKFLNQNSHDWRYFWGNMAYPKLIQFLKYLIFDQFLAISLIFGYLLYSLPLLSSKENFFISGYHLYFWSILFFTGIFFKIPPRILTPAISILLSTHLVGLPPTNTRIKWPLYARVLALGLLLVQVYKINHRVGRQQQRQQQSEAVWEQVKNNYPGYLIIAAGLENELRALNPFKNYSLPDQQLLSITSWQTLDPHYAQTWYNRTGQFNLGQALIKLSRQEKIIWIGNPEFILFLKQYFKFFYGKDLQFTRVKLISNPTSPEKLGYYSIKIRN